MDKIIRRMGSSVGIIFNKEEQTVYRIRKGSILRFSPKVITHVSSFSSSNHSIASTATLSTSTTNKYPTATSTVISSVSTDAACTTTTARLPTSSSYIVDPAKTDKHLVDLYPTILWKDIINKIPYCFRLIDVEKGEYDGKYSHIYSTGIPGTDRRFKIILPDKTVRNALKEFPPDKRCYPIMDITFRKLHNKKGYGYMKIDKIEEVKK